MKTFMPYLIICYLSAMLTGAVEGKDITSYQNLEGLQKVSKTITMDLSLTGSEPVDLDEGQIRKLILAGVHGVKIGTEDPKEINARINVTVSGVTTGGGGAELSVKLSLISRVPSPYKKDRMIAVVIWAREKQDKQAMTFDAEKRKMVNVKMSVNERIYSAVEELMRAFQEDYKKANTR